MSGTVRDTKVVDTVNEVRLRGRVAQEPQQRELPSGDSLITFRVIVDRASKQRTKPAQRTESARRVDTIDIACWSGATRRAAARLHADDIVDIRGALRRRFWRAGTGAASRYEVEAVAVTRGR